MATMPEPLPPEWVDPPDLATASAAQIALAARVVTEDAHGPVRLLGGVDISNTRFDPENRIYRRRGGAVMARTAGGRAGRGGAPRQHALYRPASSASARSRRCARPGRSWR